MVWKIEFNREAKKDFDRFDHATQRLLSNYLSTRIALSDNPRQFGKPLSDNKAGLWRYRIDKYRIICRIEDHRMVILVVRMGKRDKVYDD